MIQANECRIGNLIQILSDISGEKYNIRVDASWFDSENDQRLSEPIPLTPDILEKAGFEKQIHNKNLFFLNEFRYRLNEKEISLLRGCDKAGESQKEKCGFPFLTDNIKIEYVHKLQNLYFALTGNELEINF